MGFCRKADDNTATLPSDGVRHSKACGPAPPSAVQLMDWYSEYGLCRSSRNRPPPSNRSPGVPRATAMIPRTSGDKTSTGGTPTPRSIDLEQEGPKKKEVSKFRKEGRGAQPFSTLTSPNPWFLPGEVVLVPVARACGSPKCQSEGTEVFLGPKEGLDNR